MATESTIQAVERSFEVIDALLEVDRAGVTELADEVGISVSGTYKHLATLRKLGYIEKQDGKYAVTYELYRLGERVRGRSTLYRVGRTPVDQLARLTFARANLYVRENERAVCLYSTSGGQDVDTESEAGRAVPLGEDVAGRVMLTHEEEELHRTQSGTPESGLTVVDDHQVGVETRSGHRRIAIAVIGAERTIGSIEVFAPTDQIEGRLMGEDILSMMVSTAKTVEYGL